MKMLATIGLSAVTAIAGTLPAEAFPSIQGAQLQVSSDVQQVKQRKWYRKRAWNRGFIANRGDNDGGTFRRYYRRGDDGHRNHSHRYRFYRHGHHHRHYDDHDDFDDFGAVFGGLAVGAILGGLLTQSYAPGYRYNAPRYYVPSYYGSDTHVGWCYARYRSYRADDNSFQPYYGPRRLCISPYYYSR
ncbi:BA14K family protein [Rhizobium sp. ARZ01]|uniref:BA14K family protein n=1 Tax=Rhizobium sp. ARZ01 TaxID=2769313 RepID=UPI00177FE74D|nr:BA14K family protein [Rhizobium sp. ARZ01]MBD9372134.1 BA14K family protein [Rhizobium sp. ARZ01]